MDIVNLDIAQAKTIYKARGAQSNKGTFGHALIIAGSKGKMGAALIAAKACLRSGVGLLTANIPEQERFILQSALPEAMLNWREDIVLYNTQIEKFNIVGIGPGIGLSSQEMQILEVILNVQKPLVIDADAITLLSQNNELLSSSPYS